MITFHLEKPDQSEIVLINQINQINPAEQPAWKKVKSVSTQKFEVAARSNSLPLDYMTNRTERRAWNTNIHKNDPVNVDKYI